MNQKEWKKLSKLPKERRPKDLFFFRNLVEKMLGYKRNSGLVIHHLRDTEEQRIFNDTYYERWGLSFDGTIRYTVLITKEEHLKIHSQSPETREKISKSVSKSKRKLTNEERKQHKKERDRKYREEHINELKEKAKIRYKENSESIKKRVKAYRETHRDEIRERKLKWRHDNRDHVNQKKREYYRKRKNSSFN